MISAILLSAGLSKRMGGENKLTKKINGEPLINHTIKNILASEVDELIIVIGYQSEIIKKLVDKNDKIKFVLNENFEKGMASSIKIGLENLSKKSDAFFICLGDMPLISKNIYEQLIKLKNNKEIIVPTYKGKQGNPVLFSILMKKEIMKLKGDVGAKEILISNKNKILNIETKDKGITIDLDTKDNFISLESL